LAGAWASSDKSARKDGTFSREDVASRRCSPVRHRDTDSFKFCFESQARRHLRPDRLVALGVPDGPVRKELVEGRPVTLTDASMVDPEDVLGPPEGRKKLVITETTKFARPRSRWRSRPLFWTVTQPIARDYGHITAAEAAHWRLPTASATTFRSALRHYFFPNSNRLSRLFSSSSVFSRLALTAMIPVCAGTTSRYHGAETIA
jgi:hypothetical protein